jgi:phage-related protein
MMTKVLQFRPPSVPSLRLREISKWGVGEITAWFDRNKGARAKFRIRVHHLQKVSRADWNKTQFRQLDHGLAEIKWKFGKTQFRVIGFDFQNSFVMLLGCTHKMNVYTPTECLRTAQRLKKEVENGQWQTLEFTP